MKIPLNIKILAVTTLLMAFVVACGNTFISELNPKLVGGPCEGCEAIFEFGQRELDPVDTLPGFEGPGKKLKISGTIYESDGVTPAENAILYVYHTDQHGNYTTHKDDTLWGQRHGHRRAWLMTDEDGRCTFYTIMPGAYPDNSMPAHIHAVVLERSGKYYWIEDYTFEGDPLLKRADLNPSPRGGSSGIITLTKTGELFEGRRDIILGRNIPEYE